MKQAILTWILVGAVCASAQAQVGETGAISTRSDVRMSVEGATGTGGSKLDALAKILGKPLGEVKHCYAELVKDHPEVVGKLVVELTVPDKGAVKVRSPNEGKALKPMDRCIDKAFGKLDVSEVPKPAGALITFELSNTSAAKVNDVKEQREEASKIDVKRLDNGAYESQGKSTQGEVSYRVSAKGAEGSDVVQRVHEAVREALPSLFDCRRRAGKKGSPEGDVVLAINLKPQDKADIEVSSCSVPADRTPFCVDAALTQFMAKKGRGRAEVTIHFNP